MSFCKWWKSSQLSHKETQSIVAFWKENIILNLKDKFFSKDIYTNLLVNDSLPSEVRKNKSHLPQTGLTAILAIFRVMWKIDLYWACAGQLWSSNTEDLPLSKAPSHPKAERNSILDLCFDVITLPMPGILHKKKIKLIGFLCLSRILIKPAGYKQKSVFPSKLTY